MRNLIRILLVVAIAGLGFGPALAAPSAPGSGTATINPLDATVATPGKWTIVYDPADSFTNGTIRFTIPNGWTAPQDGSPASPGYVTVSADHAAASPSLSISGQQITVTVVDFPNTKTLTLVYGNDTGGAGGRAVPPTASNPSVVFLVESDPLGTEVAPIASSPTVNLKAGTIVDLEFTNVAFAFQTTTEGGPYSVVARDTFGNSSPVSSNQQIDLSSTSAAGTFSALGGGSFSPVTNVTMASGSHTVTFYYRDTASGTPTLEASGAGQSGWGTATQMQAVAPGPPSLLDLSLSATTITAGDFLTITIDVVDLYGNATNLLGARTFTLTSSAAAEASLPQAPAEQPSGQFFLPGDHNTQIFTLPMSAGQQTAQVDYRSTDANGGNPHLVIIMNGDPPPLSGTANVTVQAGPIDAAMSTVSATPSLTVGSSSPVTVSVTDQYGNPKSGVTVTIDATGNANHTNPASPTNGSGQATGSVTNTTAETVTVSASANGIPLVDAPQVVFTPGAVSEATSLVDAVSPIVADGATQSQITITAKDTYGNRVSGATVTLAVAPSSQGETLTQPPGTTDTNGQAFGWLRSTKTGPRTVNAWINGTPVTDTAVIQFAPGEAASFEWSFTGGATATAGIFKDVTLTVRDELGNVVTDYADTVFISTSAPTFEAWGLGVASGVLDTRNGNQWYYVFDPSDGGDAGLQVKIFDAGAWTLDAVQNDVSGTSGSLVVAAGPADKIEIVSGSGQEATAGAAVPDDLVVRVRDQYNNLVNGAQVTFGNLTGGGWVDVAPGGGARDSVATTNASGEARCDVWTLGPLVASSHTVTARIPGGSTPSRLFTATATPGPGKTIEWTNQAGSPLPGGQVTVNSETDVFATLRDVNMNPVPDKVVSIFFTDAADGLLKSSPYHATTGGTSFRQGTTDGAGRISVIYQASATAGRTDIIDATGDQATAGDVADLVFTSVSSSAIHHYVFTLGKTTWTANELVSVQVRAFDQFNNPIDDDTTPVQLSSTTGQVQYTSSSGPLTNGIFSTTAKSTVAESVRLIVSTNGGEPRDTSGVVTVVAGPASGTFAATPVPATITADGVTQSTVTSEPIKDAYQNVVKGAPVTVTTDRGTIFSADQDPVTPGIQRLTDNDGKISFIVRSGTIAGTANVGMQAVAPGTANGATQIVFAPKPSLTAAAPIPDVAVPGQSYEFDVDVTNTTTTACTLQSTTSLRFTDGTHDFTALIQPASPRVVNGLGSRRISFQSTLIDPAMAPGARTPWIEASWKDVYGGQSSQTVFLPANSLRLSAIETKLVDPALDQIVRGETQDITVTIENKGPIPATINAVTFTFSVGNQHFGYESVLSPPLDIPGASTRNRSIPVTVLPTAPVPATTTIDAAVSGTVNGTPVSDPSLSPYPLAQWEIRSGAELAYVDESLVPRTVSRGKPYAFKVQLENTGDTTLELRTPGTKLSFTDGSYTYESTLAQNEPIGSGATREIAFNSFTVPAGITPDRSYDVKLHIEGVENAVAFEPFDLFTSARGDSVRVERAANVTYAAGTLSPTLVSQGLSVGFRVDVNNSGTAVVALNPSQTWITFGGFTATLDPDPANTTIENGTNTLRFVATAVNTATGTFTPQVRLQGTENSLPYGPVTLSTSPNTVRVDPPAAISIASITNQPAITINQVKDIAVTMTVTSASDAAVRFDSARVAFLLNGSQNRTYHFGYARPTGFSTNGATLPGRATDTLEFTIESTNPAMTPGNYVIEGYLWVTPVAGGAQIPVNTSLGGKGNILAQTPGVLDITLIEPSRDKVTTGQSGWTTGMSVRNTGGADIQLDLSADSTFIGFSQGTGWSTVLQTPGPITLSQNASTTIVYGVTASSSAAVAEIRGTVRGVEINSDDRKTDSTPPGQGTITVQAPGALEITNVTKSQEPVTENKTVWTIAVRVRNPDANAAEMLLSTLADSTYILFPEALSGGRITGPSGVLSLPGGQETVLTFQVSPTPDFALPGLKTFQGVVRGRELNRNLWRKAEAGGSVTVELQPNTQFVRFYPTAVKRGDQVQFQVKLYEIAGASEVDLTPLTTVFKFGAPPIEFRRSLDAAHASSITAGDTTTLWFEPGIVPIGFADGPQAVSLALRGTENGSAFSKDFLDVATVHLRPPTTVSVDTMVASRPTVSAGQTRPWQVRMVVSNTGSGDVSIESGTRLVLRVGGVDVTGQYTIEPSGVFEGSGTNVLASGATDAIVFGITKTGSSTGSLTVYGIFAGKDVAAGTPVGDDTFDSGWTTVLVQTPGNLLVTGVSTSRTQVTAGQTTVWTATVNVTNTGQATVGLTYDAGAPQIRFAPDSGFDWTRPDSATVAGTILPQNAVASLVFPVTATGTQAGTPLIHAVVAGIDTNSTIEKSYDTQAGGSGWGSIIVESRGRAVLTSTEIVAPKPPQVNLGQLFAVKVEVSNGGGADLLGVVCQIASDGGSVPQSSTIVIPSIAAGDTVVSSFIVTADNTTGPETFTVDVATGADANSGQVGLLDIGPHVDPTETIEKFERSQLVVDTVTTSQPTVTRSQTQDWFVDVAVTNAGGAPLDVVNPAPANLEFSMGGPLAGYVVIPPARFVVRNGLRLGAGETDTLRYRIDVTGDDVGTVTVRAAVDGKDANDLSVSSGEGSTTVAVVAPSGLFIATTAADPATAPNVGPEAQTIHVNSGRPFTIEVTARNLGEVEDVVDVKVRLVSDHPTDPVDLVSESAEIPKDGSYTFRFVGVTPVSLQPSEASRTDVLTAAITSARSKNTGVIVTPTPPADNTERAVIEKPASLSARVGVTSTSVSTEQRFDVTGSVINNGVAEVGNTGRMALILPEGFTNETPPDTVSFAAGEARVWSVRAPSSAAQAQPIRVKITSRPNDENIAAPAAVADSVATVLVDVLTQGGFESAALDVSAPPGATDGTVSTGQQFTLRASAIAEATTVNIRAKLSVLSGTGFTLIDQDSVSGIVSVSGLVAATWRVTAPSVAGNGAFRVRFYGDDENSGKPVHAETPDRTVTVVTRADLAVSAAIERPEEATDGRVAIGSRFEIDGVVSNSGQAGIDPANARVRINFAQAQGYSLYQGTAERAFTIGQTITWVVSAPESPTLPGSIRIEISSVPADENSGNPAYVGLGNGSVSLPVQTDDVVVTADNVTSDLGIDTRVAPRGAPDIEMLAVEFVNSDNSIGKATIDTIAVSMLTATGDLAASPSQTLSEIYALVRGNRVDGALDGDNPVVFDFKSQLGNVVLDPASADSAATIVFAVSVRDDAALGEFVLSIEGGGDVVIRSVSQTDKTYPVVDRDTGGTVAGRLRSQPLIILSGSTEEYAHNYPNPFRAGAEVTRIAFRAEDNAAVSVKIFDMTGGLVYEKQFAPGVPRITAPGAQEVTWDGTNLKGEVVRNGMYVCELQAGGTSVRIRIAVAK